MIDRLASTLALLLILGGAVLAVALPALIALALAVRGLIAAGSVF